MNSCVSPGRPALGRFLERARDLGQAATSSYGCVTLLACAAAVGWFYSSDWNKLRHLLVGLLSGLFGWTGHAVSAQGLSLQVDNFKVTISRECTYIDWFLCAAPFLWRRVGLGANLLRILVLAGSVAVLDVLRVYLAIALALRGWPWFLSHDLFDDLFWYPGLGGVILLWILASVRFQRRKERILEPLPPGR